MKVLGWAGGRRANGFMNTAPKYRVPSKIYFTLLPGNPDALNQNNNRQGPWLQWF